MALKRITEEEMNTQGVIAAPDILNGTPTQNKTIFDRMVRNLVAPAFNACVDAVEAIQNVSEEVKQEEEERKEAEQTRTEAEQAREEAEENRTAAEEERKRTELARATAEDTRVKNENTRALAEQNRATAETQRVAAEKSRADAETARAAAEQARVNAETARTNTFAELKKDAETATGNANTAAGKIDNMTVAAETLAPGSAATVAKGTNANGGIELKFGIPAGDQGATGNGIKSIEKTGGTGAAGTYDTYTITLTDGSTFSYKVLNGANGKDGDGTGDMVAATYDPTGKATDIFAYVEEHGGVQSDWTQNDETAKDYVKNRTHYSEIGYGSAEMLGDDIIENFSVTFTDGYWSSMYSYGENIGFLNGGKQYRVIWDGTVYDGECDANDEYNPFVGGSENGYPFKILFYDLWCMRFYSYDSDGNQETGTTTHTLSVYEVTETVKQLDAKFLPDSVKAQSDWNQNDESAPDYVKNRTHYVSESLENMSIVNSSGVDIGVSLNEQTATFTNGMAGIYAGDAPVWAGWDIKGATCAVVWDGVRYDAIVDGDYIIPSDGGSIFKFEIANTSQFTDVYCYAYDADGNLETGTTTHTFSVYEVSETVVPLDEKFLPDTVAKTADVINQIGTHNADTEAHSDIRTLVSNAQTAATNAANAAATAQTAANNAQTTANSKAPMYTYDTADIEAGSASPYETGHLHFVIE